MPGPPVPGHLADAVGVLRRPAGTAATGSLGCHATIVAVRLAGDDRHGTWATTDAGLDAERRGTRATGGTELERDRRAARATGGAGLDAERRGTRATAGAGSRDDSERTRAMTAGGPGLTIGREEWLAMVAHCLGAFPEEGCGLLGGDPATGVVGTCYPTANAAASARIYTVDSRDLLRADRAAEARGESIIGVFHSHTHTDAYPSPTDVDQAPDPSWHYVLVSLRDTVPSVRSYRIVGGEIAEEPVTVAEPPPV